MDRFREMEVFAAVADAGSLVGAARRLRVSPPVVTRMIAALEDRLGVPLLTRTTRRLGLTEAGSRYLAHSRRLLAEIDVAERDVTGDPATPQGHLAVTASVTFGRSALVPVVGSFLRQFPSVTLSLTLVDRIVDLVEEGLDVGVRIGDLADSSLIARKVGEVRRILVAHPDHIARAPALAGPQDLKRHRIIAFTGLMANREWHYRDDCRARYVRVVPWFEVNDAAAAIAAAAAGEGIAVALSYMVAEELGKGRLVQVLPEFAPDPVPVQIVYPQSRLVAPKVRAFVDFAAPRLKATLEGLADVSALEPGFSSPTGNDPAPCP